MLRMVLHRFGISPGGRGGFHLSPMNVLKVMENLSFPSCCHKNPCFGGTTFLIQKKSMSFLMNKRNGFLIEKGDSCPDLNRNFIAGFSHQQLFAEKLWICAFWYGGCWKITTSPRCLRRLWETGVSCGNAFFQRPWFLSWKQHPTKALHTLSRETTKKYTFWCWCKRSTVKKMNGTWGALSVRRKVCVLPSIRIRIHI